MTTVGLIALIGIVMVVTAVVGGILAGIKNRDISFWLAWTFLVPPSVFVLLFLPKRKGPRPKRTALDEEDTMLDKI